MRVRVFVLIGLLGLAANVPAHGAERAIWVWEGETYAMLEDPAAAAAGIELLGAKKIGRVYLYADAYAGRNLIVEKPALYRELIRRLRGHGIRAYALLGSWHLHTEEYVRPARHAEAVAMLRRVLKYNAGAPDGERFEGVNLDIEPHLLDEWGEATKAGLLEDFLDLGRKLMALKRRMRSRLSIGPAIPFWLDGIDLEWRGARKPVSEHVIDTYDYVALMDYRDHSEGGDGMIEHARSEMAYADLRGKRVVIGVDISPGEPKKVSFDHLGEADLERALAATASAFQEDPAFGGFVVHHFAAYRRWLGRLPPGAPPPR